MSEENWETISQEMWARAGDSLEFVIGKDSRDAQYRLQRLYPPEPVGDKRKLALLDKFLPKQKVRSSAEMVEETR